VVPVPRALCAAKSREVCDVLRRFTPVVEAASIDEAYLDMTGTEALYHHEPLLETARRMREAVLRDTSISVSIGGGASRLVAKMAAERAKPAGIHIVAAGEELSFMRAFRLADLPGVGPVFAAQLERLGLTTVDAALVINEATLCSMLGATRGRWLHRRIRGVDGGEVRAEVRSHSVSREETFARDICDDDALERELLELVTRLARDLRAGELRARTFTVKIRDGDFRTRRASRTLKSAVESDRAIVQITRALLRRLRAARRVPARLLGVAATGFNTGPADQLKLIDDDTTETDRDRRLARTTDQLRRRFGRNAIRSGLLLDR
jgi:DNA polymerase-4